MNWLCYWVPMLPWFDCGSSQFELYNSGNSLVFLAWFAMLCVSYALYLHCCRIKEKANQEWIKAQKKISHFSDNNNKKKHTNTDGCSKNMSYIRYLYFSNTDIYKTLSKSFVKFSCNSDSSSSLNLLKISSIKSKCLANDRIKKLLTF